MRGMSDMVWPNYFKILTALTLTAAAAVLAALLIASAPASAQEDCTAEWNDYIQPDCNETGVPLDTSVWTVTGELDPNTVNTNTFTLVKQGTTTPVPATVTYYGGCQGVEWSYCSVELVPSQLLEPNTTYTATLKGGENGVKSADGVPYTDFSWSFTTGDGGPTTPPADTTPPVTSITDGPSDTVYSSTASFSFSSNESGSTFECKLDGANFESCTSPKQYTGLSQGEHTFSVRATDPAGNTDPNPATLRWTVSTYSQTVDNADSSRFSAKSGVWRTGSSSQAYGSDYRYTPPKSWSYYAYYKISAPTAGKYKVYAWWPAFSSNNSSTAFWIWTTSGWAQKNVDQRTDGGQWYPLGEYDMNAGEGWNIEVDFGRYSASTGNIVADAVKIERQ
jgi:hypothetical protein